MPICVTRWHDTGADRLGSTYRTVDEGIAAAEKDAGEKLAATKNAGRHLAIALAKDGRRYTVSEMAPRTSMAVGCRRCGRALLRQDADEDGRCCFCQPGCPEMAG